MGVWLRMRWNWLWVCVSVFVCVCMGEWACLCVERRLIVVENALAVVVSVCGVFEREV